MLRTSFCLDLQEAFGEYARVAYGLGDKIRLFGEQDLGKVLPNGIRRSTFRFILKYLYKKKVSDS